MDTADAWQPLTPCLSTAPARTGPEKGNPGNHAVYVAWTKNEPGEPQRIVLSGSTDGGQTYTAPSVVSDDVGGGGDQGYLFAELPEPASVVLLAAGLFGLGLWQTQRRRPAR